MNGKSGKTALTMSETPPTKTTMTDPDFTPNVTVRRYGRAIELGLNDQTVLLSLPDALDMADRLIRAVTITRINVRGEFADLNVERGRVLARYILEAASRAAQRFPQ